MNFSIRTKLLAAFAVNLLLMIALGTFGLFQMSQMNEDATFVESVTIPSLDTANEINLIVTKYHSYQLEYAVNISNADKIRIEQELPKLEQQMTQLFASYTMLTTGHKSSGALAELRDAWTAFVDETHTNFLPAFRLNNTGSVQPSYNRLNPIYDQLVTAGRQLTEQNQAEAKVALSSVRNGYQASRGVIIAVTMTSLIISAAIGLLLAARFANRISRLTSATVRVAAGDFGQNVAVRANDELGLLAANFNQMVTSLRYQRTTLEQRSAEIAESLRRQQQLTDDLIRGRQAEEAATRARVAAEAASQAKSMFLATMSHELRTPLTAILGYTQLLQMRATRQQPDMVPELERLRSAGKHLLTIISNILDFSKIEQGRMEVDLEPFQVISMIREIAAISEPLAHERNNSLRVLLPDDAITMHSDAGKLRQILFNLLSNAIKFTEDGVVIVRVQQELRAGEPYVVFAVTDTGIGITDAQLDRLFEPFTQGDASVTRRYGGTGLGLALSRQLAWLIGGDIWVASRLGAGSTFSLVLPQTFIPGQGHLFFDQLLPTLPNERELLMVGD